MSIKLRDPFHAIDRFDLAPWHPSHGLTALQAEINNLFERLTTDEGGWMKGFGHTPSIEMEETETEIILKLEAPGMEAKDLDVEVTQDTVTVRGERKTETKIEEKNVIRSEFEYGKFERMVSLPAPVENGAATAEYKDGLLRLVLPKADNAEKKAVKLEIS